MPIHPLSPWREPDYKYSILDFELNRDLVDEYFSEENKQNLFLLLRRFSARNSLPYFISFVVIRISQNTPKIYVGTYGMYNSGSLFGKWFDLLDYANAEAFYKDCYEYHRNEFLPELMFQDWECIPGFLISECSLHEDTFRYFEAISEMDNQKSRGF